MTTRKINITRKIYFHNNIQEYVASKRRDTIEAVSGSDSAAARHKDQQWYVDASQHFCSSPRAWSPRQDESANVQDLLGSSITSALGSSGIFNQASVERAVSNTVTGYGAEIFWDAYNNPSHLFDSLMRACLCQ